MHQVIVCVNCNGSSQVDERAVGAIVQCPLCGKPTAAKMAQVAAAGTGDSQPLSLDDLPERPLNAPPQAGPDAGATRPKPSASRTGIYAVISAAVTLLLMAAIYLGFRFGKPDIPDSAWKTFEPPDGHCGIRMPGNPEMVDIPAEGPGVLGGRRFKVNRWFERVEIEFGWIEVDADMMQHAHFDSVLFPFLTSEAKRRNGKLKEEQQLDFIVRGRKIFSKRYWIETERQKVLMQVYFDPDSARISRHTVMEPTNRQFPIVVPLGPFGEAVPITINLPGELERQVIDPGQRLRLYFAAAAGNKISFEMPWAPRFFNSFVPE